MGVFILRKQSQGSFMGIRPLLRRSLSHIPDLAFHVHAAPTNIYIFFNGRGILKLIL